MLGHEGAGIVREVGAGVTSVSSRAIMSFRSTRPNVASVSRCLSGKTNLCTAIRATQGKG